ncbi:MAG: HYR domain-containing protein, partial [Acidobacteria bacterium]|nr:HYR domain-containing protein [Acidobacteriota bacterium]
GDDALSGGVTVSCLPGSGSTFGLGSTVVSCVATDGAGNTATGTFTVTVRDTTAPVVTVPAAITVEAAGPTGAPATFSASALDAVAGSLVPVCTPASGSIFPLGASSVTCAAADSAGNTGTASFVVTVRDTTPPVLALPAPLTVAASSASGAVVSFTASATDLVGGAVTPVCTPSSGATFAIGTTPVTCTATDWAGNRVSGSFTVTVQLQYGFLNVKNLPPPSGTAAKLGSSLPLSWRWTLGGTAVNSADALPLITITGPSGATTTFTPESPGSSSFQYSSSTFTWQFNWQTKGLAAGYYAVTVTSRKTGQAYSGGQIQLK